MNKNEFASQVAKKTGYTKKDVMAVIETSLETIVEQNASGEFVNFAGFGKFDVIEKKARECKNPSTGEIIHVEAHNAPKFKPATAYKDAIK